MSRYDNYLAKIDADHRPLTVEESTELRRLGYLDRLDEITAEIAANAEDADDFAPTSVRGIDMVISPDLDAYASGRISVAQIRCVLCRTAPCSCTRCPACGMTEQARYGGCPRGCSTTRKGR